MTTSPAPTPPALDQLSYVYAVVRAAPELNAAASRLSGMYGVTIRTVVSGGLAALVCSVPEADFGDAGLKAQLEDLERLETIARSHHAVIDALSGRTTVLPLRLATVYFDDERVSSMLRDSQDQLGALLDRLEGHLEWGVKVYADPGSADSAASTPVPEAAAVPDKPESPGRAYLQRRRAQRSSRQDAYRAASDAADRVASAAGALASAEVAHRPQQGELAGGTGENIANQAYLVPSSRAEQFRAAVEDAGRGVPGVRVEVTGPWAPYSFATPAQHGSPAQQTGVSGDGCGK